MVRYCEALHYDLHSIIHSGIIQVSAGCANKFWIGIQHFENRKRQKIREGVLAFCMHFQF